MTLVSITSLIVISLALCSYVRSQKVNSNRNSFTMFKYPPSISVPKLCYIFETDCLFTPYPHLRYSTIGPLDENFHEMYKRQLNLMSNNYDSPALKFERHRSWTQPFIYRKLSNERVLRKSNSHNTGFKPLNSINSFIVNNAMPDGAGRNPNAALSNKIKLLQSINNPFIYDIIKKYITDFYVPTRSTNKQTYTKATSFPITAPEPYFHKNESITTPKSNIMTPKSQYEQWDSNMYNNYAVMANFLQSLDRFERTFYKVTFTKLSSISPVERRENGISFVQSGLFLQLALMALSSQVDPDTRREIDKCMGFKLSNTEKKYILQEIVSTMPKSNEALKFRLSTRLVLGIGQNMKPQFQHGLAPALQLNIDRINTTDTVESLTATLNKMVDDDSGGAMHDTFEEDELSEGICAVLLTTIYLRARWRSSPTVLNGTHVFQDASDAPPRSTRMIRINDLMRYTELSEWDAEAIEIFYASPGLSLLMLVPRGRSLRKLSAHLANTSIHRVLERMYTLRLAVTLPLYTLRMTLLLPGKLQSMGISRLVGIDKGECEELKLSHALQRLMFWAEAGRNAFKDDGIEWDEVPALELVVNRPYIFFVRWRNITLMNGNFVL